MIRPILSVVVAAALAACASTPVYAPATSPGAAGFSETQIEANRFFVTYRAPGAAAETLLQDYALLRAADLTLAHGRDWFWLDRRTVDSTSDRHRFAPSVGIGVGAGSVGRRGGVNVGVGVTIPALMGASGARATATTLEIRFGEGVKPDAANAYDAHVIGAILRARLLAPR